MFKWFKSPQWTGAAFDTPAKRIGVLVLITGGALIVLGFMQFRNSSSPIENALYAFGNGLFWAIRNLGVMSNALGGLLIWCGLLMVVGGIFSSYLYDVTVGALIRWIRTGSLKEKGLIVDLGVHPSGGRIKIMDGRYGPYVSHNRVYATIPKTRDPSKVTKVEAIQLLAQKLSDGPRVRGDASRGDDSSGSGAHVIDRIIQEGIARKQITEQEGQDIRQMYDRCRLEGKTDPQARQEVVQWLEHESEVRRITHERIAQALKPVKEVTLFRWNGCGLTFLGSVSDPALRGRHFTQQWFTFLWIPLFRLGTYLVAPDRDGYRIYGKIRQAELDEIYAGNKNVKIVSGVADGFLPILAVVAFWGLIIGIGALFSRR